MGSENFLINKFAKQMLKLNISYDIKGLKNMAFLNKNWS